MEEDVMSMTEGKCELLVSRTWPQVSMLVFLFGFLVLGMLAYRTYVAGPPVPARVVDAGGNVLFTADDIRGGQQVFLRNGLMEYGSVFGHGGYLGPDYTADYLHRAAQSVFGMYARVGDRPLERTIADFKENRYEPRDGVLHLTAAQAAAFAEVLSDYRAFFAQPDTRTGLRQGLLADPTELRQLTAFFAWSAWAASARRPGHDYSYTNNWPPEPLVDNHPTAAMLLWSMLSLAALLGGIGVLFAVYGRYDFLGWHGREQRQIVFRQPGDVTLTPAQRACAWFFLVMAPSSSCCKHWSAALLSITVPSCRTSSASTSPGSCRSTWRAPGTCSSRSCGCRRHIWRRASSWRR
jgi:nitric oxide reductase subunit B